MAERLGIVINGRAGRGRPVAVQELRSACRSIGAPLTIETGSVAEVPAALQELKARGVNRLLPWGGDGTLSTVLTHAAAVWSGETLPEFALVRAGTMNMVADHLELPRCPPLAALQRLSVASQGGSTLRRASRRALCVNRRWLGFSFGFGAPVRFLLTYEARGPGFASATRLLAEASRSALTGGGLARALFEPVELEWTIDGRPQPGRSMNCFLAMTIDHLPMRFAVMPGAGADGQRMHLLHGSPHPAQIVRNLYRLWRGHPLAGHALRRGRACEMGIELATPQPWMVDGEIHAPESCLRLSLGPMVRFVWA